MSDLQVKYDSICYHLYNGVKNLSEGGDCINFVNFDHTNDEHKLVLAITAACSGILGNRNVTIDCPFGARRRLASKYKKTFKVLKNDGTKLPQIDVNELLDGLREWACQLCGENFTFGEIYKAYYEKEMGYDI